MFVLTPAERRGALLVVALLLIGTAHDLWTARRSETLPASQSDAVALDSLPVVAASPTPEAPSGTGMRLDLNSATREELDGLPGIGPVLAGRILDHRARVGRFRAPEELLAVRGIGPRLYARLRDHVQAGAPADSARGK